jgi:replication-associated recombination protein RarA
MNKDKGLMKEDNRLEEQEIRTNRLIDSNYLNKQPTVIELPVLKEVGYSNDELSSIAFFEKIYSMNDLKLNVYSALTAKKQTNTLLFGPPASAKSLFMQIIEEKTNDCLYFDASNASGAGLIEALYENQESRIVCIDEIGMLNINDLDALRGLLNNGRVIKTLKKRRYDFVMNCKIFATTNDLEMPLPILSRFQIYEIPAYTDEDFIKVAQFCLADEFPKEISGMIASILLSHKKKDIRQVLNISRIIKPNDSEELIMKKIETTIKYKQSSDVNFN